MSGTNQDDMFAEIYSLLSEDTDYPLDGTLLYVEADEGYVSPSIYKDRGNHIIYRSPDLDRLGNAFLRFQNELDSSKRWVTMEYMIRDDRFTVTFGYPDEIDIYVYMMERREEIVRKYFGDKPVVYPPWDEDDKAPSYEL